MTSTSTTTEPDRAAMPPTVEIVPGGPVRGAIRPPGSKSITNRALLIAALADPGPNHETSILDGTLVSEDTSVMVASLRRIGVEIDSRHAGTQMEIRGIGDRIDPSRLADPMQELFVANSGTTVRFLTAALSAVGGRYRLSGVPRMHERPIGDLIHAIEPVIGGQIQAESDGECPPVRIESAGWRGDQIGVGGSVSSQYLSGLMMAAPAANQPIAIQVDGELVSRPYVSMTASVMRHFGARVDCHWSDDDVAQRSAGDRFDIRGSYAAKSYAIEPDASAASYFWAAAAITGGDVFVNGLSLDALQGDVGFADVMRQMGCDMTAEPNRIGVAGRAGTGIDIDMNAISDTVQTLAIVALFADSPTRVRGVAHNRFKETDRIGDLACECRRLGATVDEHDDGLTIHPLPTATIEAFRSGDRTVELQTYHDHRMAMSFSLLGLMMPGVSILDPACTGKTYPNYWADLESLTGRAHRWRGAS